MIIYMENNEKEKKEKTGWVAELISWVQVLVSAAVIAFVLTTFVIANSEIPTGSMENTIMAAVSSAPDSITNSLNRNAAM
mgnify:CR=1 FL=1